MAEITKEVVEGYAAHLKKCCLEDRQKNKARRIAELRERYRGILSQAEEIGGRLSDMGEESVKAFGDSLKANLELRIKVVTELRALGEKVDDAFVP